MYSVWVVYGLQIELSKMHVFSLGCIWLTHWTITDACYQNGQHMVN